MSVYVFDLRQNCNSRHGVHKLNSVNEIDLNRHWIDRAAFAADPGAYWEKLKALSEKDAKGCKCKQCLTV